MVQNLFGDTEDRVDSPEGQNHADPGEPTHSEPDSIKINEFSDQSVFAESTAEPASVADAARRDGLAYSAGIAFFASVIFMLILGWGADLLLGSSPWGVVGGIVIGSGIGLIQLFRLSSQIFKK